MNNKEKQKIINEALSTLRMSNRGHQNCIRLNPACSRIHNEKIINYCLDFIYDGIPFYTEAIFKNNSRCDILLPATNEIIEIAHTESERSLQDKEKKYPDIFNIWIVRV